VAQHCTIFFADKCYQEILTALKAQIPGLKTEGNPDSWTKIVISDEDTSLTLSSLVFVRPMEQFSKIVLGSINLARRGVPEKNRNAVMDSIGNCGLIVGVKGEPYFTEDHDDYIELVASCSSAIVLLEDASFVNAVGEELLSPAE
jgi:hypothetical protein